MVSSTVEIERTFLIAERALELMKAYGSSAAPRSYEVWYTYVNGNKPLMNDAIKRISSERGTLSDAEIDALYDAHLCTQRYAAEAEKSWRPARSRPPTRSSMRASRKRGARWKACAKRSRRCASSRSSTRSPASPTASISRRRWRARLSAPGSERSCLALIVIDIDYFERFNDTYGHLTGDQVLKLVGMTMREVVKANATLARFGGEEFAIILPGQKLEGALAIAENLRKSVMSRELVKRSTGESLGKVTISAGVAALRQGDTAVSLLERADQCMYLARRMGRNRTMTDQDYAGPGELPEVA